MKEDAPKIHEKGNLLSYDKLRKGDVEKGFDEADVILERTYQVPFLGPCLYGARRSYGYPSA